MDPYPSILTTVPTVQYGSCAKYYSKENQNKKLVGATFENIREIPPKFGPTSASKGKKKRKRERKKKTGLSMPASHRMASGTKFDGEEGSTPLATPKASPCPNSPREKLRLYQSAGTYVLDKCLSSREPCAVVAISALPHETTSLYCHTTCLQVDARHKQRPKTVRRLTFPLCRCTLLAQTRGRPFSSSCFFSLLFFFSHLVFYSWTWGFDTCVFFHYAPYMIGSSCVVYVLCICMYVCMCVCFIYYH